MEPESVAQPRPPRQAPTFAIAVSALLLICAALRLAHLGDVPPGLHFDEAVYGLLAEDIRAGARPVFFSAYTGREPLYMYCLALVFAIVGPTAWAIRLTSALIGTVTIACVAVLGKTLFGPRAGMAAAGWMTFSYWHLTVSRNGYPNVLIPPLVCAAAYWLWRGWRTGTTRAWLAGGALSGLVLYTYLAARFWPITLALVLPWAWLVERDQYRRRRTGIGLAMLATAAVTAPLAVHFLRVPADFWERANQVLANRELTGLELLRAYGQHAWRTVEGLGLPGKGDPRWHFNLPGRPMWQPLSAALIAIGAVTSIGRARRLRWALVAIWAAAMTLPGVLTLEMQPAGQRIIGALPAMALLAAVGAETSSGLVVRLAETVRRVTGGRGPSRRATTLRSAATVREDSRARSHHRTAVWLSIVIVALAWEGLATGRDYFGAWARHPLTRSTYHADYTDIAHLADEALGEGARVVVFSEHYRHPTVAFAHPGLVERVTWADPRQALPLPRPEESTVYLGPTELLRTAPLALARLEALSGSPGGLPTGPTFQFLTAGLEPADDLESNASSTAIFGGELAVTVTAPADDGISAPRNRPITVSLEARVVALPEPASGRGLSLRLVDGQGVVWSQLDQAGVLVDDWREGDRMALFFEMPVDRSTPPGDYRLELRYRDAAARNLPVTVDGRASEAMSLEARVRLAPAGRQRAPEDALPEIVFAFTPAAAEPGRVASTADAGAANGLAVLDHTLAGSDVVPGGHVDAEVLWARLGPHQLPESVRQLALELEHDGDTSAAWRLPIASDHAPARWAEGELLRGRYHLRLPPGISGGVHDAWLSLPGQAKRLHLGGVNVARVAYETERPRPGTAIDATFLVPASGDPASSDAGQTKRTDEGDPAPRTGRSDDDEPAEDATGLGQSGEAAASVTLLGLDAVAVTRDGALRPLSPGTPPHKLQLTCHWTADRTPGRDLKVFVHLYDADGTLIAQHDAEPARGTAPLSGWPPGTFVSDDHLLEPLPGAVNPAGWTIGIGLYDPLTGQRAPVLLPSGTSPADAVVRLPWSRLADQ